MNGFDEIDPLEMAKYDISNDSRFETLLNEIKSTHEFVDSFGFLQFGRDMLYTRSFKIITPTVILNSTIQTLLSIRLCCEHGNFADANILLRKYRDDLFFYLYMVLVSQEVKTTSSDNPSKHDKNVEAWMNNNMSNLHISDILKYIGNHPTLKQAVQKYNLQAAFNKIGNTLNTYTHGNGIKYYNRALHAYEEKYLRNFIKEFPEHISYITISYLFLLALINPLSFMSTDYIDYLDCGQEPPEGSQYLVAPFIQNYMSVKKDLLGNDCIKYLQDATNMDFS